MDYMAMQLEDLELLNNDLAQQRLELLEQHKAVKAALEQRAEEAAARAKVAAMSDAERAALAQALGVDGIDATPEG